MLHALNASLEAFLRSELALARGELDVSFHTPDDEWRGRVNRPTVNLFLHEVRRSGARSVTGTASRQVGGVYQREQLAPFVRVQYAVTAWAAEPEDEHRLLGNVLTLVLTKSPIAPEHLQDPLGRLGNPVELALASDDYRPAVDLWTALGVPPKATVELVAILPVCPPLSRVVPDPPDQVDVGVGDTREPSRQSHLHRDGERVGRARGTATVHEG